MPSPPTAGRASADSLNVVLIIVGIAAVLAVGVCALIAFGVIKRRRKGMDSSAKPLFAIGPASTGSFTHTPDSATSPSTALVNPRPSDSAPGPILGLTAPLDLGPPSARSAGAAGRGLGSAGSSDLDAWAFGSVNGGNSKGPYVGAPHTRMLTPFRLTASHSRCTAQHASGALPIAV